MVKYKRDLTKIVDKGFAELILDKKERFYLVPLAPQIPIIYLPKVHKNVTHPPGRPIISGIDSVTSRIERYIDFYLQPLVRTMSSYLKGTKDTIQLLDNIEIS